MPLHSLCSHTVLSSCTLLPPLESVPLHSLYSRLCTLDSALCTLDSAFSHSLRSRPFALKSVLSTLHSRSLHSNSAFSHSLYSRLCILVVCTLTLHSHTLCTVVSTFSGSELCICTLTLRSHRTQPSLLSSLCPRTLHSRHCALALYKHSLHSQSLHFRFWILALSAPSTLYSQITLSSLRPRTLCTLATGTLNSRDRRAQHFLKNKSFLTLLLPDYTQFSTPFL